MLEIESTAAFLGSAGLADDSSDEFNEFSALHDQTAVAFLDDTHVFGNGSSSHDVVSSHHSHLDACSVALLNGRVDFLPGHIPHSDDTQHHQLTLLDIEQALAIFLLKVIRTVDRFISHAQGSKRGLSHLANDLLNLVLGSGRHNLNLIGLRIEPLIATCQHHLRCPLDEQTLLLLAFNDDTHSLPSRTEWEFLDWLVLLAVIPVFKSCLLDVFEYGDLSGRALLFGIEHGCAVHAAANFE